MCACIEILAILYSKVKIRKILEYFLDKILVPLMCFKINSKGMR